MSWASMRLVEIRKGYTEADVPRLIKEVRAEKPRRRVRSNG